MSEVLTPDLCIIGAGAGGLSVAAAAANLGVSVVLVEKGAMGGDCLNFGCVPSKALIAAARAAHDMQAARKFGIHAGAIEIDFPAVMAHVRQTIAAIAPTDSQARFEALNVRVIRAPARFTWRDTVEAGGYLIRARRFVIATGSSPAVPNIPGLEQIRPYTNETIFGLEKCPEKLVILGAGPIGLELGQAFGRLGSHVTILEAGRALAREDDEFADIVVSALRRERIEIREGAKVVRAQAQGDGFRLELSDGNLVEGSHLLVATGRRANVEGLGLETAGVRFSPDGIETGRNLRTANRRIYAVGDVVSGSANFTHAAAYHAGLVLRATLFRLPARVVPHLIPRVTFTDPEIAATGYSEAQARKMDRRIRILRWPFADNDRARAEGLAEGHVKLVIAGNGRILGASMAGRGAGEMIGFWQLAIAQGLKIGAVASLVLPYPTMSEASRRAALAAYAPQLTSPRLRALLGLLRKFG